MSRLNIEGSTILESVLGAGNKLDSISQTLGADYTVPAGAPTLLFLDPGGSARNVDLPAEEAGLFYIICNTADAAEVITVRNDAGTSVGCTPTQNEVAVVFCDGTSWHGFVGTAA